MRIAVIGAGVLGASVAYHAARDGADVVVINQAHDGRATAAGAGIVCPWASGVEDPVFLELYAGGARAYLDLISELAAYGDTGYRRSGALCVSGDAAELDFLEHMLRQRAARYPECGTIDRLSSSAARELFPPLRNGLAAVRISGGARVDGRRLAATLLAAATAHGASIHRAKAEIVSLGSRVSRIQAGSERIAADAVVVTAGAWASDLLRPLGIDPGIEPQRGQITHLRLSGTDTSDWPVILPPGAHYLLAFDESRIVVGATRETGVGFDYRVTAAGQAEVLHEALAVAPGLAEATLIETRIGFRPVGRELRPLLGLVKGYGGLAIGNGLGASGLTIGPFAGRLLAEAVMGRRTGLDLRPFDPMRSIVKGDPVPLR